MDIRKWNLITAMQKSWVGFKQFFRKVHCGLRETTYLTVQDTGMHHANMVRNIVAGLQEVHQQKTSPSEVTAVFKSIQEPQVRPVANSIQDNQQKISTISIRCKP